MVAGGLGERKKGRDESDISEIFKKTRCGGCRIDWPHSTIDR
jgi:hypothetical protein